MVTCVSVQGKNVKTVKDYISTGLRLNTVPTGGTNTGSSSTRDTKRTPLQALDDHPEPQKEIRDAGEENSVI